MSHDTRRYDMRYINQQDALKALEELFNAKGKSVILSAPNQLGLDKKAVVCSGLKKPEEYTNGLT